MSSGYAQGVARFIFEKIREAHVYLDRMVRGTPPNVPGTLMVIGRTINDFGQYYPGGPSDLKHIANLRRPVLDLYGFDSRHQKAQWCQMKFDELVRHIPLKSSIAMPKLFGWNKGGGSWMHYLEMIYDFGKRRPNCSIVIYDMVSPPTIYEDPIVEVPDVTSIDDETKGVQVKEAKVVEEGEEQATTFNQEVR